MPALEDFRRSKGFAVCVDSDGCAMDTMNIKHMRGCIPLETEEIQTLKALLCKAVARMQEPEGEGRA